MKDKQILIDYKEYLELERKAEEHENITYLLSKVIVSKMYKEFPDTLEVKEAALLNKKILCELLKTSADEFVF